MNTNYREMRARWFAHSQERAMERYGLLFTSSHELAIQKAVDTGEAYVVCKLSATDRGVYRMELDSQVATFVYCRRNKCVVTFLHNSWVVGNAVDTEDAFIKAKGLGSNKPKRKNRPTRGGKMRTVSGKSRKMKTPRLPKRPPEEVFDGF